MSAPQNEPASIGMAFVRSSAGVDPFYSEVISGMEEVLHVRGMRVLMQTVPTVGDELAAYQRWAATGTVAGVVVSDLTVDDPRGTALAALGLPHVTLGEPVDPAGGAVVRVDNYTTTVHAVQRLVALGHRVIGRVSGPQRLVHTQARAIAFADAIAAAGATASTAVGDYSGASGAAGLLQLLDSPQPPSAVVFDNDLMAVAGLDVARARGLSVPDDLSILAWDDSMLCRLATPALSAMSHDVRDLGALAAKALLAVIDGGDAQDVTAPLPVFVERGSTAPPRTGGSASTDDVPESSATAPS